MAGIEKRTEEKKPLRNVPFTWIMLDELKPHEDLVEKELERFIESFITHRVFWLPILVSKKEKIILDGHHRTAGLKKLGAVKIPAIFIDYDDPEIQIDTWHPLLLKRKRDVLKELEDRHVDIQIIAGRRDAVKAVRCQKSAVAIIGRRKGEAFLLPNDSMTSDAISEIEKESIGYIDSRNAALDEVDKGNARIALIKKPLSKNDVRKKTACGEVFPPKSTRHVLPFTIQRISVRIEEILPGFSEGKLK